MADGVREVSGRDAAALLLPRPVVLVGTRDGGEADLSTVAWNMPLSYDPLLIGVAIKPSSTTYRNICATGAFTVSVIGPDLKAAVDICGSRHGDGEGKAAEAGLELVACETVDAPRVAGALSWFECETEKPLDIAGDHVLVVGRVLRACTTCESDDRGLMISPDTLLCLQHGSYGVMAQ